MTIVDSTVKLGDGWVETDFPSGSRNPDSWVWDRAVTLYYVDDRMSHPVDFDPDLIGKYGTLTAVMGEPNVLNEVTRRVRRYAPVYPEGTELTLGTGTVRLRQRKWRASDKSIDVWNGPTVGPHWYTALGLADSPLDSAHMRALFCQPVTLRFTPINKEGHRNNA